MEQAHSKRPDTGLICKCLIENSALSLMTVKYNDTDWVETWKLDLLMGRPEAGLKCLRPSI